VVIYLAGHVPGFYSWANGSCSWVPIRAPTRGLLALHSRATTRTLSVPTAASFTGAHAWQAASRPPC
jgi:hypothetical protein